MKLWWKIVSVLVICMFVNSGGYCLYRDDVDYEEVKSKIEIQRQKDKKNEFEKYKIDKYERGEKLEKKGETKKTKLIADEKKGKERGRNFKFKKIFLVGGILLFTLIGYLFLKYKYE